MHCILAGFPIELENLTRRFIWPLFRCAPRRQVSFVVERSVNTLGRESGPVPDLADGYRRWRQAFEAGKGGIFTISVAEAFDAVIRIARDHK